MNFQEIYHSYEPIIRPAMRISPLLGGLVILLWRVRESRVPVTARSILIPPLAMSTGFAMFIVPMTRVPWSWGVSFFLFGLLLLAWPIIWTSRLESRDGLVYMQRSRAFLWILLVLLALRVLLHEQIGHIISPLQTGAVFFLLAFGMIVHWRGRMYLEYRRLVQ